MPKILFEINYNVKPEKREDYLNTIGELKGLIRSNSANNYSVFESKKDSNNFSEIYICENEDDFDKLEDNQDEKVMELTEKLFTDYIQDGKVVYNTRYEI